MKDKKTIGFDILDNARLDEIDKIGTDMDMLDNKTKKRILEMTRKRYNDVINGENTGIYDNAEDVVDNVEVYSRKKSTKIIMSVVNTAAALGLAVGSVFLVKNLGRGDNDTPDDPLLPSESTSVGTDIETAAINVLDYLAATDEFIDTMDYGYLDMNGDNVAELLVKLYSGDFARTYVYQYDGSEYIFKAQFIHGTDDPVICIDEKRIYTSDYEFDYCQSYSTWDDELNFTEGDKLERVWGLNENNTYSYFLNGETISEDEYKNKSENFVTGEATEYNLKNYYNKYDLAEYMADDELEIFNAIDEAIHNTISANRYCFETLNPNEDVYKLQYGFMDFNGDSVDELIIHEELNNELSFSIAYYKDCIYNYFQTSYSENIRFDADTYKMYSGEVWENKLSLTIDSWAGVDFSKHTTGEIILQPEFYNIMPTEDGENMYIHNGEPCDRAEYEAVVAEYEACPELNVDYKIYSVKDLLLKYKPAEKPVQNQTVGLTQEEIARNKRLEYEVQATFECYEKNIVDLSVDDLKIDYAYLDINNDSVDELFVRSKVLDVPESESTTIYFFNGTEYIAFYRIVADEFKFDLQNRKYYEILKENDDDTDYCILRIRTWENVEFSDGNQDYLTYFTPQDNYEGGRFYLHNDNRCTKEEYDKAMAEYENCVGAELNFIPYTVKKNEAAVNGQSAEETARNKRIEDYIQDLYECYGDEGENFYESIKIDYAYLDINNDSIDELFIRYNLYDNPEFGAIDCNYFDGTEYIPFTAFGIENDWKLDLQNRKYYTMRQEKNEVNDHCVLFISTWENVKFSADSDYFTLQDRYYSGIDPFIDGTGEQVYLRNNEPCTKGEYDKAMAEYENCNSAELNFISYNVKKPVGSAVQTQTTAANINNEETLQTTTNTTNKPTQEVLDKAKNKALENISKQYWIATIKYAFIEMTGDEIPELIVENSLADRKQTVFLTFDGEEYIIKNSLEFECKINVTDNKIYAVNETDKNCKYYYVYNWDNDINLTTIEDFYCYTDYDYNKDETYIMYIHNDAVISEKEFENLVNTHKKTGDIIEYTTFYDCTADLTAEDYARKEVFYYYSFGQYSVMYYAYTDFNSDGITDLLITGKESDTDLNLIGIYYMINGEYVYKSEAYYKAFKLDLHNKKIYYVDETNGIISEIYSDTWDNSGEISHYTNISIGDEGFEEALAEYEACETANLEYHKCW